MRLDPYLIFDGKAEKAFKFYSSVFGGEMSLQRYKDAPEGNDSDKVMHVSLQVGESVLMGSDAPDDQGVDFGNNFNISISIDSKEEADRIFGRLKEGGHVLMAMENTFWGAYFGMVRDKFGVQWMVSYSEKGEQ